MNLAAVPKPLDPVAARGAWRPIQQALMRGSSLPPIRVSDPMQAEAIADALRRSSARSRWLLSLIAADPHRVLRAAGITLEGKALARFDQLQELDGWGGKAAEFEGVARAPSRLATPRLTGTVQVGGSPPCLHACLRVLRG